MGERPDDVPSLEALGSTDELPEYWTQSTTITVDRWVKESLDEHRNGQPWNQFLETLRREHADPITLNDAEELAEFLVDELGATDGGVGNLEPFGGEVPDRSVLDDDLREQLDRIERAANTVEDRTGRIERTLEDMGAGR